MGKQRQRVQSTSSKHGCVGDYDLLRDDWVIVKKQKVTIIIPALIKHSETVEPKPCNVEVTPVKNLEDRALPLIHDNQSMSCTDHAISMMAENMSTRLNRTQLEEQLIPRPRIITVNEQNNALPSSTRRFNRPTDLSEKNIPNSHPILSYRQPVRFLDGSLVLNKRLRALLLEKKIQKAGGLRNWLESLGLKQFVQIFQGRNSCKFLLVNMSMNKLKHMGANAVGPRRKLMHAIDCICQPCCFQSH